MKKQTFTVIGLMFMFLSIVVTSGQAAVCSPGTVASVQIEDQAPSADASRYKVRIACPAKFTGERVYWLSANLGESGYATLLTAVSLVKDIHMEMTGYTAGSIVTKLQLVQ